MYRKEMKKIYKNKLIIMFGIFMAFMVFSSFKASFGALGFEEDYLGTKMPITVTLSGSPSDSETVFKYEIKAQTSNLSGAQNEPTELIVSLNSETDKVSEGLLSKTQYIDFSNTTYTKAGVYKYIITEKSCSNEKEFPLSTQEYKISVEAEKQSDGSIKHSLYKYAFDLNRNTKEDNLSFNHIQMTYIKFQMIATGENADSDEYYKLTVSIFGESGAVYDIVGQDSIVTYNGEQIETLDKFEVTDGNYSFDIYLKNNQTVYIGYKTEDGKEYYQIPVGTYANIVQNDTEKYKTYINDEEGKVKRNFQLSDSEENVITITNDTDEGSADTGVFISILPYIVLGIIVVVILGYIIYKKIKDKKDNEDN